MLMLKPTLILCAGIFIGLAAGQLLPAAQATAPETKVETRGDQLVFLVKGEEVARIDAQGLRVTGDVEYMGTLSDIGAVKK